MGSNQTGQAISITFQDCLTNNAVYFLIYNAHPNKETEAYGKYASASIACWINTKDREVARIKSRQMIEERNWTIESLDEEHPLSRKMAEESKGLQYYEQALIDGEVLVFFTSPTE